MLFFSRRSRVLLFQSLNCFTFLFHRFLFTYSFIHFFGIKNLFCICFTLWNYSFTFVLLYFNFILFFNILLIVYNFNLLFLSSISIRHLGQYLFLIFVFIFVFVIFNLFYLFSLLQF